MNMAKKISAGSYQIGIWSVDRVGGRWRAWATCVLGDSELWFPSLSSAHLALTGEPMRG